MKRYGVPYRGSKNLIAEWVVNVLPKGKRLVDFFAGGCAVTHAALLSGKYERVLANDISELQSCEKTDSLNINAKSERLIVIERVGRARQKYPSIAKYYVIDYIPDNEKIRRTWPT